MFKSTLCKRISESKFIQFNSDRPFNFYRKDFLTRFRDHSNQWNRKNNQKYIDKQSFWRLIINEAVHPSKFTKITLLQFDSLLNS